MPSSSTESEAIAAVTAARGFLASGVHCGIRHSRLDLALLWSERPAAAAAVFTRNLAQAAPILVSREHLRASQGAASAVVINAGNANACTGAAGLAAARETARAAAALLDVPAARVLVASTGVIGKLLPLECILGGLPEAARTLSVKGGAAAAHAILTTDTRVKESVRTIATRSGTYTVGGMAKGSGMIHPDLATTLAFVTTDARVAPALLQTLLGEATELSFNRISVDGDTSTNDMIALLANGASGVAIEDGEVAAFARALGEVLTDLAKAVARDGEGATRLITVAVTGAASDASALQVARTVAGSPLVKTAVHGADANWGRVVAAAGRAGVPLDPARLRLSLGGIEVLGPGFVSDFAEDAAREALRGDEVTLALDLGGGAGSATAWTCDLTADYVAINASYRS